MPITPEDMNQIIGEITKTFYSLELHDPNETVIIEQQESCRPTDRITQQQVSITFHIKNDDYINEHDYDDYEPYSKPFISYGDVSVEKNNPMSLSVIITFRDPEETCAAIKVLQSDWFYQKMVEDEQNTNNIINIFRSIDIIKDCIEKDFIYEIKDDVSIEQINSFITKRTVTIKFAFDNYYDNPYSFETVVNSIYKEKSLKTFGYLTYDGPNMDMNGDHYVKITIEKHFNIEDYNNNIYN
jgi:hypothetical protein